MKLELQNVGKIKYANIKLDGMTVIAGENNTGKSTIGKMLFCLFSSFHKIEEQVDQERIKTISRVIVNFYHEVANRFTRRFEADNFASYIVENRELFLSDSRVLKKELGEFYLKVDNSFERFLNNELLEQLTQKINNYIQIEDKDIRTVILTKRLIAEFAMKVNHLNWLDEEAKIHLSVKSECIDFKVRKNEEVVINENINLIKDIIYIDDPFVLDDLNGNIPIRMLNPYKHNIDLLNKIANEDTDGEFSVLDELVVKQKLERIIGAMSDVCDGELIMDEGRGYEYKTGKLSSNLDIVNLSTGMKSFVILRKLLQNGSITENGIVVLDEPEIHLHPEWQLRFAEIIVLIQKEFATNFLINTHSPYFLNAIEVYSEKYEINKVCNYYLTEEKNMRTEVVDATNNMELIYEKLARPLQQLENMEYR